jgi:hypothetical protein
MTKETQAPKFELDLTRDYAEVIGDPQARYMQDYHLFNAAGDYVGEAPEAHKQGRAQVPLSKQAQRAQALIEAARRRRRQENAERSALEQAAAELGDPGVPAPIVDATKENAKALRAEQEAE